MAPDLSGDLEVPAAVEMRVPGDDQYLFPRHPSEIDRLDVQHYALRLTVGSNYVAPIGTPGLVLDSGSGSGQWAYDLCREFPGARVIGVDLWPGKPDGPPNFSFVRGNLLHGVPFADAQFDFVHQRFLVPGVPLTSWDAVIAELVRVTRPGGWVELVEGDWWIEPAGAASRRLLDLAGRLGRTLGLDAGATIYRSLDRCLTRAGLIEVQRRTVDLPLGEWGGRVGSLMASDYRAAGTRLSDVYWDRLGVPVEECHELIHVAAREWDELRSSCRFALAIGRRRPS